MYVLNIVLKIVFYTDMPRIFDQSCAHGRLVQSLKELLDRHWRPLLGVMGSALGMGFLLYIIRRNNAEGPPEARDS